ncbi:MAG: Lrp/AsnC family transcriptional regulator [Candidatus Micrarchaeota archaeon]|nr:Lrp/AsnC family transcriptional regulator [Candidatus Micrarchaeota archaeon]
MDELDERIIEILKEDSRTPFVDIAKRLNLSEGAIRVRVKKLTTERVIERFTIDVKNSTRAVVMISTSQAVPTTQVSHSIRNMGVDRVYEISGNYEIICFVQAKSIEDLNSIIERIRATHGVTNTSTSMVLK